MTWRLREGRIRPELSDIADFRRESARVSTRHPRAWPGNGENPKVLANPNKFATVLNHNIRKSIKLTGPDPRISLYNRAEEKAKEIAIPPEWYYCTLSQNC